MTSLAQKFGTPLYVYSATAMRERFRIFNDAFATLPHTICYSVKANPNLSLLQLLARDGAGFDVVSGGELERVLTAHRPAGKKVVFSGVGKTAPELDAAIKAGILLFNVESESELDLLAERAAKQKKLARVALRVNPDVSTETHPYISTGMREHKFGVAILDAPKLYARAAKAKWLDVAGVSVHIGSQITSVEPFNAALSRLAELIRVLLASGHNIRYVDAGGGLGVPYTEEAALEYDFHSKVLDYSRAIGSALAGLHLHLLLEPGRAIVAPAGALLTRVLYKKKNGNKEFLVIDAAMNDLIRPALYKAHHEIVAVRPVAGPKVPYDVVGPICETGDFMARERQLSPASEGDLLAILDVGAYGMSLASNYNTRPRAAEVLVEKSGARLIRKRETVRELLRAER